MGSKKSKVEEPPESGPRKCSKCYLVTLNSFIILAGLCMIGLCIWVATEYKGLSDMVSSTIIWTPLGIGLGLCLVGMLGFFGSLYSNRCSLCIYVFAASLLLTCALALAILLFIEIDAIHDAADAPKGETPKTSAAITDDTVNDANTFIALGWNRCCLDRADQYGDMLYEAVLCSESSACSSQNDDTGCLCYNDLNTYNFLYDDFDPDFCSVMEDVSYLGSDNKRGPIVGVTSEGGCGGGDPKQFQFDVADYAEESLKPGAIALLVLSLFMLLGVIFGCFMFVMPLRKKSKMHANEQKKAQGGQQRGEEELHGMLQKTESERMAERDDIHDDRMNLA